MKGTIESNVAMFATKLLPETNGLFVRRELRTALTLLPRMGVAADSINCLGCLAEAEKEQHTHGNT